MSGLGGANPDAAIRVARLAKSITAIAVALLIQDGKLALDSKLGALLGPMFTQRGHPLDHSLHNVTIEQLLSHTAGLRASSSVDPVNGLRSSTVLAALNENASVFDYIVTSGGDRSSGVGRYAYSNLSYAFLGLVIEAVSGESYGEFCRQRIFDPLGIRSATLVPGKYHAMEPFGGWEISTADMIRIWTQAFRPHKPVDPERSNSSAYAFWQARRGGLQFLLQPRRLCARRAHTAKQRRLELSSVAYRNRCRSPDYSGADLLIYGDDSSGSRVDRGFRFARKWRATAIKW